MGETRLVIRTTDDVRSRWKILFSISGARNYSEFVEMLLDMYEFIYKKYGARDPRDVLYRLKYGIDVTA